MKYNQINRLILFGGAPLLAATAKMAQGMNLALFVYTSPRHIEEVLDDQGNTLKDELDKLKIKYCITENINQEKDELFQQVDANTLGIGMGEAWSFDEEIIKKFSGRLLDFMGIPHPRYRGGAHYTWMILRGDKIGGCNLQVINTEMIQGEFDSGEIVKSVNYNFPESARIPLDYFNAAVPQEINFIKEFLQEVEAGKEFNLHFPQESQSLFLPRLNTIEQGWINWAWLGVDIERFICAFDEPYAGASTLVNGCRVHLKTAYLDDREKAFHSFQSGLVDRITPEEGIVIASSSGLLKIKRVLNEIHQDITMQLKLGDRFYTLYHQLEESLLFRANYNAKK